MSDRNISILLAELRAEAQARHTRALTLQGNAEQEEKRAQDLFSLADRIEREETK